MNPKVLIKPHCISRTSFPDGTDNTPIIIIRPHNKTNQISLLLDRCSKQPPCTLRKGVETPPSAFSPPVSGCYPTGDFRNRSGWIDPWLSTCTQGLAGVRTILLLSVEGPFSNISSPPTNYLWSCIYNFCGIGGIWIFEIAIFLRISCRPHLIISSSKGEFLKHFKPSLQFASKLHI